ncbi:hypothetical protein NDU88_002467 [Pleurodeles waltl]|uniref:LIM and calponin homology domains 1 n=1 Tax=Pleurodeles waltl TaxID=8319 RepID=A0AAV7WQ15_PLEWA|nr:hypothetical protein NDU88_002467 [Pleurodeles waltl]
MGGWQSPFHPPCLFLAARWWRGLGSHSCGSVGAAAAERRVAAERSRGARPGRGYRCQLRSPCARAVRSRLPPAQSGSERMASPGLDLAGVPPLQESAPEAAFSEAQKWIEQVTGRCFGDKDFRSGLENGILLCELLNAIRPGLVKKINRLPTPIAGLDNISLFLRGCKELGLKESQLFDPGDLQDTSNRAALKNTDYSRKLKNVLVTIYWLGKAANSCTSYSGATLDLKEFEGLLAQMRKETDDIDSPKRSIRDSGYIDCWDSERSDSLSPPRHGRDDSFDSLDSFGSRSQQTPSPDVVLRGSSDGRGSDSESDFPHRKIPDVKKDDMSARRISYGENKAFVPFNQYLPNKSNQTAYIPAPLRKKKAEREEYRKSWSTATSPLGGERPFRSVSMFDVRCDDAAVTQPHSRVHQEQLQNVNNLLKEEDDQWQDDLARWKTRRRSVSQDLIKKEEERKKMEKVLSGEDALSERRKSIKTYREIVEEKERREKELHEAYKNAKSQEEAEKILQKYIERFTISEAVLESLQMPKILERRHSVEPNKRSPPEDPNPMKYLRQHSLPVTAPKFTATVEASISPTSETEAKFSTGRTSPTKTAMSKAVPLLVPKPYSQPKTTHALKTFKVDGKVNMNGEAFNGIEDENESRCASVVFAPSASRSQMFEGVARIDEPQEQLKPEATTIELNLRKPVSRTVYKEVTASPTEERIQANQKEDKNSGGCTERRDSGHVPPEVTDPERTQQTTINSSNTGTTSMEHKSTDVCKEVAEKEKVVKCVARDTPKEVLIKKKAVKSETNELEEYAVFEFFKKPSKATHPPCQNTSEQVDSSSGEKSPVLVPTLNLTKRVNFWTWDPEEERKRQERWQQEQERLLQERYQKEQEKLKDEWEKAQKEVEEEERKYLEEERKIIEDTVVPFTISSSSAEPFSSCSSSSVTENNMGPLSLVRPVGEQKNHHEVAEQQTCAAPIGTEHVEEKQPTAVNEKQNSVWDQNGDSLLSNGKGDLWLEKKSRKEVSEPCPETLLPIRSEERSQTRAEECSSPARMQLHLQGAPKTSQHFLQEPPVSEEHGLKASSLGSSLQVHTSGGIRRNESHENIRAGQSSPCSPTPQCHSPGRAVSGKKLCSTCGLPLGKGAAMIIETLSLYFHIQCFQCGICKGQLGDTTSGTDVRIRNGLLNCNDCYIRSRTAGQPTTL